MPLKMIRLCSLMVALRSAFTAVLEAFRPWRGGASSSVASASSDSATATFRQVAGQADVLRRADGAELELVARERERRRAVAVAGIARQLRQRRDADVEHAAALGALRFAGLFDLLEDVGEHVAEEHRQDGRRRFVGAEPVIVAGVRDAEAEQALPHVHRANHRGAEEQELHVVVRRVARVRAGCCRGLSPMLQFRCLPEPLTPANGFS